MQHPSNQTPSTDAEAISEDAWEPCPAGLLEQAAAQRIAGRRAQQAKRAMGGIFLALAGAASVLLLGAWVHGVVHPGGIDCAECQARFSVLHDHLLLAAGDRAKPDVNAAREHLAGCRQCRAAFDERYPGLLPRAAAASSGGPAISIASAYPIRIGKGRPAWSQ